jgi:tetrapyrrole methylase family protein / MazG family protein
MENFKKLLNIADTLLSEKGCPWDKKQTITSMKKYVIEEAIELNEAIEKNDIKNIIEEAGDVLYSIIFITKLAEKKKIFTLDDVLKTVTEKLIRRHPHVFDNKSNFSIKDEKDVEILWKKIKQKEKAGEI